MGQVEGHLLSNHAIVPTGSGNAYYFAMTCYSHCSIIVLIGPLVCHDKDKLSLS